MLSRMAHSVVPHSCWRGAMLNCILPGTQHAIFSTAADQQHLKISLEAGLGMITIDRPKALNAKNCGKVHSQLAHADQDHLLQDSTCLVEMVEAAHQALADFVHRKEAAAVLIDSTSDKAFCAGIVYAALLLHLRRCMYARSQCKHCWYLCRWRHTRHSAGSA